VRVAVIQERAGGFESQGHREPATERFDQASSGMIRPERNEMADLPPLPTRPLQWRAQTIRLDV
jgi:hypothetical protein